MRGRRGVQGGVVLLARGEVMMKGNGVRREEGEGGGQTGELRVKVVRNKDEGEVK